MPLPAITDVFQATWVWSSASAPRPATNTMYWFDSVGTQDAEDLANDLDANVNANLYDVVGGTSTHVFQVETKALLDPEPAPFVLPVSGAKWTGGTTSDPILQGAAVISIKTALAGKSFRGRIYLPFVGESAQTAGVLSAGSVALMQTAWNTFLGDMATDGWLLGVVSQNLASFELATQVVVRPNLLTQRRRARR